jgi:peptidoglycan/LPS O-acetylase OafA/YrhL
MAISSSILDTPAQAASMAGVRFGVLDSWRGICALLVALFHLPAAGLLSTNGFVRGSYLFVDFFFVLSGFVIAHAYGERLKDGQSLKRFMVTRFGRLFPLHAFMLLAFVAFELVRLALPQLAGGEPAFTGAFSVQSLFANLFMMHGLGIEQGLTWNGPSWSISTELFAYLLFGVTVLFLNRFAMLAFAAAVFVAPFFLLAVSPDFMDATWDFGFIRCIYGFSFGVLIQALFAWSGDTPGRNEASTAAWTFAEGATVAAVVLFVASSHANAASLLAPFVFGFAVFIFAHEAGLVSRLLSVRAFLGLGALSYSIYMTHMFVQMRIMNVAKFAGQHFGLPLLASGTNGQQSTMISENWALAAAVLMIAATLAASAITYRFVEMPGRDWFRNLANRIR